MINIRVEIKGDKRVIAQLKNIKEAFSDWKPELRAIGDYLKDFYQDPVFETEGGIFGARWQPLSNAYHLRKATVWPGRGILEASGRMRRSYQVKVFANLLELMNTTTYAVYHQEGRGVPERLLMRVDKGVEDKIVDIFKKGVLIKIQKAIA